MPNQSFQRTAQASALRYKKIRISLKVLLFWARPCMGSIFNGDNGFGDNRLIEHRVYKLVGVGSKPTLVPNPPSFQIPRML
jgi:hypothetical protein